MMQTPSPDGKILAWIVFWGVVDSMISALCAQCVTLTSLARIKAEHDCKEERNCLVCKVQNQSYVKWYRTTLVCTQQDVAQL